LSRALVVAEVYVVLVTGREVDVTESGCSSCTSQVGAVADDLKWEMKRGSKRALGKPGSSGDMKKEGKEGSKIPSRDQENTGYLLK
jgi:hypothetical protein